MRFSIFLLFFLFLVTLLTPFPVKGKVLNLNPRTYRMVIHNPQNYVFVLFYSSWCVTCPTVNATWEELGHLVTESESKNVVIARVDAGLYTDIARSFEIKAYPSFLLFSPTNKTSKLSFNESPEINNFVNFLVSNGALVEAN